MRRIRVGSPKGRSYRAGYTRDKNIRSVLVTSYLNGMSNVGNSQAEAKRKLAKQKQHEVAYLSLHAYKQLVEKKKPNYLSPTAKGPLLLYKSQQKAKNETHKLHRSVSLYPPPEL